MGINEIQELETNLEKNGYKKWTTCLSSSESWGWFKSIKNKEGELKYQIEYRVWDWRELKRKDDIHTPDFGIDILILMHGNNRVDMIINDIIAIDKTEKVAEDFYNLCINHMLI